MIERPSNVLVGTTAEGLPEAEGDGSASFVVVSLTGNVEGALNRLRGLSGGEPEAVHVVHTGGRSGAVAGGECFEAVYEVEEADDLAGMSMRIGNCVSDSHDDDLYLYFDTVTDLLGSVETMTAYRFLNALTGRVRNAGGVGYFGLRPDEHEPEVLDTFGSLFSRRFLEEEAAVEGGGT